METNTTLKVVHRLLIEEPQNDPAFEATELSIVIDEDFRDTYDYFPDFGI
ncbi:MAG TPA: hypothetical protein PLS51_10260 [Flavobacterium sp.]|nr:hypothetical protein [Flavobacterium sp.]HPJ11004.1 hypothetical protein [Flavobacterium sp.]